MEEPTIEVIEEPTVSELFKLNIERFIDEISALDETLPLQMVMLDFKHKNIIEKLESISESIKEVEEDGEEYLKYKVASDKYIEFSKVNKRIKRLSLAEKILPRNHIVSLVNQYDAYLGELVRILFTVNSNLIRSSQKEIQVEDLFKFDSLDEIKMQILDKEIDSILREEHLEQLKILERKISKLKGKAFTLTTNLPILKDFIELTQRRNLFVHTNGFTSRQYSANKVKFKFDSECSGEINFELKAPREYCKKAFETLFEMSAKLTHVLWRAFAPEEREEADKNLNTLIYNLLQEKRIPLAVTMSEFATTELNKYSSEQVRKFLVINKAIAYKMSGDEQECSVILKDEDWTIGTEFKLAKSVLEKDYKTAATIVEKIGDEDEVFNRTAYREFPLFFKFRETVEFKESYKNVFKEEFALEGMQKKKEIIETKASSSEEE